MNDCVHLVRSKHTTLVVFLRVLKRCFCFEVLEQWAGLGSSVTFCDPASSLEVFVKPQIKVQENILETAVCSLHGNQSVHLI